MARVRGGNARTRRYTHLQVLSKWSTTLQRTLVHMENILPRKSFTTRCDNWEPPTTIYQRNAEHEEVDGCGPWCFGSGFSKRV